MKLKKGNNKAFTLIELLVAIGVFVVVISFAGRIFKVSLESHRVALANAEIMQKFRAITSQLDSDFSGLDKDGEIFVAWNAILDSNDVDGFSRLDRIMFFSEGDFQAYGTNVIRGNMARICYTIANNGILKPEQIDKPKRVLARTQHILTEDENLPYSFDPNNFTTEQWYTWNNLSQYDKISLEKWKWYPIEEKANILSFIMDIDFKIYNQKGELVYETNTDKTKRGATINTSDPNSMHMLLCEGVGEFKIQGWDNTTQTWIPKVDPDGNGDISDTHFFLDSTGHRGSDDDVPAVFYSWPYRTININNLSYPIDKINRENFNSIPGLGRALKFTFTLFDSKGIIKDGRTFTYIVYLDD